MPDVEVLGWHGYTWSAVGKTIGRTAKLSDIMLEAAYGREMNIKFSGNSTLHAPSKGEISVALHCDKTAHFRLAFHCRV